ncbi:MAG: hypothetical protein E6R09_19410 [Rhodocyclaceae bacterium]|nr:MAG: hypothetical protein E6R09_19410 [Rhodocyclaceae bacterium]
MRLRLFHSLYLAALWATYPLIIYVGLRWGSPRIVGVLLLANLILRRRNDARRLIGDLGWIDRAVLLCLLLHAGAAAWSNSDFLVRLFPMAMNLGVLTLFARSLFSPQSMIERFARLSEPDLTPAGVRYTRRVTQVWCGFLVINAGVAFWTALYATQEVWALYNGLIAYVLMGILFAGEWLVRYFWRRRAM